MQCWISVPLWGWTCGASCPQFKPKGAEEPASPGLFWRLAIDGTGTLTLPASDEPWDLKCDDDSTRLLYGRTTWSVIHGQIYPTSSVSSEERREDGGVQRVIQLPPLSVIHENTDIKFVQTVTTTFVMVVEGSARVVSPASVGVDAKLVAGQAIEVQFADGRWFVERWEGQRAADRWGFLSADEHRRSRGDRGPRGAEETLMELGSFSGAGDPEAAFAAVKAKVEGLDSGLAPRGLYTAWLRARGAGYPALAERLANELRTAYPDAVWAQLVPQSEVPDPPTPELP